MAIAETTVAINVSASGQTALVAAVPGKKIVVTRYLIVAQGAVSPKFQSASTDLTGPLRLAADGNAILDDVGVPTFRALFATNSGEALNINLSAAVAVGGYLNYRIDG